jgi:hypothetical protein
MATPTTSEFLVVPINGTDLIAFFRGSNISRPLYLRYSTFLDILSQSIGGGTPLLLQTNSVDNPSQALLNLIQGSGITITDNGVGGVTIAATGGASFITSITDTADIDLDVTLSDLTATLTTTGVTANTYGSSTQVPQITVDSKGRITGVTLVNITAGTGSVISVATAGLISGGPITVSGTITTSMNTNKLVGRGTVGTGIMEEITLGTNLSLSGTTLNATGGGVTSVGLSMPSAFAVAGSPILTSGTLAVTGAGTTSQYVRGDGSLATYNPGTGGGGASVSYYLNGSVAQGTFGGVAFKQMSKTPVIGAGTDFTINADGYIQSFITDANTPNQLLIPGGNWNFEMYFSSSSAGGSPSFYVELYKWDGAALTLIASSSANPEYITNGTAIDLYVTALAVPQTTLAVTDRLAVRVYVIHSSKTIKLHTEDSHLCQVITTFTTGITALNGLTDQVQNFATPGTSGTAPNWNSVSPTHTLNIPLASTASVTAGLISNTDYNKFDGKQDALTATKSVEINTGNVELDGDETSPTARKFYSTSSLAVRGWRAIEKLDLPTIISSGALPYIEREYIAATGASNSNGGSAIIKIPGSDVIFAAYTTGNTVVAYNTTTAAILSTTTTVTGVTGLVYVASTGQVWAFGLAASITRFTATSGASLGATAITGLTASCRGVYDDSLVNGCVFAYNGPTMNRIDVNTYARTFVTISASALNSFELNLVTSGAQTGLLVGTVNLGVFGITRSPFTLAYAPTTAFSSPTIKYIPTLDKIITVSASVSTIYVYTPATATTITLSSTIAGVFLPNYIDFDETENYLFVVSGFTGTSPMKLSIFDLTTLVMIKSMPLTAVTGSGVGYIAIDKSNKCLYVVGNSVGSSINKIVYA